MMKFLLLVILITLSCNSNREPQVKLNDTHIEDEGQLVNDHDTEDEVIFINYEVAPKYKHGGNNKLMALLYSSLEVKSSDVVETRGIYQFNIDSLGYTSNFKVRRGISENIDTQVAGICDTLEFIPGTFRGQAVKTLFNLPIRLEYDR